MSILTDLQDALERDRQPEAAMPEPEPRPNPDAAPGQCQYPACTRRADVRVNDVRFCTGLDHIEWGMGAAFAGVNQEVVRRIRAAASGRDAGERALLQARRHIDTALFEGQAYLRLAAQLARDYDAPLADSCDAVALQAEDLRRIASQRLSPSDALEGGAPKD